MTADVPVASGSVPVHASPRIDDAVAFRIHRTNRMLLTHLARFLRREEHQLSPEKWFIVARLAQDGPMPQVNLTEPALVDAPNVSRLVESLVTSGLVEREVDPGDRRVRLVGLTADGEVVAAGLQGAAMAERTRVFAGFDGAQLAALVAALDQIDVNLRTMLAEEDP